MELYQKLGTNKTTNLLSGNLCNIVVEHKPFVNAFPNAKSWTSVQLSYIPGGLFAVHPPKFIRSKNVLSPRHIITIASSRI